MLNSGDTHCLGFHVSCKGYVSLVTTFFYYFTNLAEADIEYVKDSYVF